MARTNFANIKFWEDSIAKEQTLRLAWHRKRRQDELTKVKETEKCQASDMLRKKLMFATGDPNLEKKTEEAVAKKAETKPQEETPELETKQFELMLPIDKETKDILYDGVSRDGKGRAKYLKQRYIENPEDKFIFPPTSGMEYGWNIAELSKSFNINKSLHGHRCILRDTFYRKNGIPMSYDS
ncbi:protein ATP6V1FNB [Octopus bimaculoides]|uniref:Sperm microtubule inner protein 1 C-terminal domain-containing protein n=1 Tax=Octopus bimaculoides TaxID=37653 RepID=A0A0L8GTM1_OCTBM|nr:protein ATP6V1FNB [Octopus bimaculoides]|eukprot:XP_014778279.1 PREDICTED: uncharacterized protein LOC106874884 [Octopus bimaculoides]